MKTQTPTPKEIDELLAFLPRLDVQGFTPIERWSGGTRNQGRVVAMPWPEYDKVVVEFFRIASKACWGDYDYRPELARRMLESDDVINNADLAQIKTMLTYCVRGERFCGGHWRAMLERGYIRRLLQRLAILESRYA